MAGEQVTGAGAPAGTGVEPDAGGAEPGGTGEGGVPAGGEGAAGGPAAGSDLTAYRQELDPVLRGMEPQHMNELFYRLSGAAQPGQAQEPSTIGMTGEVPPAAGGAPPTQGGAPPAQAPVIDEAAIKAQFDPNSETYDPQAAINQVVQANYGPLVSDITQRSLVGTFAAFKQAYTDWDEFEPLIRQQLSQTPAHLITEQVINGAYFQQKGFKQAQTEQAERRSAGESHTLAPTPRPGDDSQSTEPTELNALEKQAARVQFREYEDPEKEYKKWKAITDLDEAYEVQVPLGGGKKG
jgi:hypothetical protein